MHTTSEIEPSQWEAIEWMKYRTEALLALPVGFGKTLVCLTALKEIFDVHPNWSALVVSTKNIIIHTWAQEIENWEHLQGAMSFQAIKDRRLPETVGPRDLLGINFESLEWLLDRVDAGELDLPEVLVIDESTKMKAHNAKRVQRMAGLRRITKKNGVTRYQNYPGYVDRFERRFLMSGTPMPESHADLWAQDALLGTRRRLGHNISDFRRDYCVRNPNGFGYKVHPLAGSVIEEKMKYVMYLPEMDRDIAIGLTPVLHRAIDIPWSEEGWHEYKEFEDETVMTLSELDPDLVMDEIEVEAPNAGVMLSKLRQICSGFIYDATKRAWPMADYDAKGDELETVIDSLADVPLLVFTQFVHEQEYLADRFGAHIGLPGHLQEWSDGEIPLLVLHPASAGHGLNLQHGSHVCLFYSTPYSYEQWSQAWGRLHRRGQKCQVSALRFERTNSVEQDVWKSVQGKNSRLRDFLNNMRDRRRRMGNDERSIRRRGTVEGRGHGAAGNLVSG